jgi:hypothetical protein
MLWHATARRACVFVAPKEEGQRAAGGGRVEQHQVVPQRDAHVRGKQVAALRRRFAAATHCVAISQSARRRHLHAVHRLRAARLSRHLHASLQLLAHDAKREHRQPGEPTSESESPREERADRISAVRLARAALRVQRRRIASAGTHALLRVQRRRIASAGTHALSASQRQRARERCGRAFFGRPGTSASVASSSAAAGGASSRCGSLARQRTLRHGSVAALRHGTRRDADAAAPVRALVLARGAHTGLQRASAMRHEGVACVGRLPPCWAQLGRPRVQEEEEGVLLRSAGGAKRSRSHAYARRRVLKCVGAHQLHPGGVCVYASCVRVGDAAAACSALIMGCPPARRCLR